MTTHDEQIGEPGEAGSVGAPPPRAGGEPPARGEGPSGTAASGRAGVPGVPGVPLDRDPPPGLDRLTEGLHKRMGIELLEIGADRTVGRMPVEGNTQPYGLLHGGASCVLAESLGSLCAAAHAFENGSGYAVGIEINATHHRAVSSGHVTGVARPLHAGRSVATYEIVITDDDGRRVCTARLTCLLRAPAGRHGGGAAPGATAVEDTGETALGGTDAADGGREGART